MGEEVTIDQLSCASNHFISSSFCDTCNSGHYARPGASLSVIVAVLVSIIKQQFLITSKWSLCKSHELTAYISE